MANECPFHVHSTARKCEVGESQGMMCYDFCYKMNLSDCCIETVLCVWAVMGGRTESVAWTRL